MVSAFNIRKGRVVHVYVIGSVLSTYIPFW